MSAAPGDPAAQRALRPLDALNFFLADVRDGLGPYLAIYLLTVQHWTKRRSGRCCRSAGSRASWPRRPSGR